jgi:hypothetical protein
VDILCEITLPLANKKNIRLHFSVLFHLRTEWIRDQFGAHMHSVAIVHI